MAIQFMTIDRHILEQERQYPDATGEFSSLLYDIAVAAKFISREVNRAGLEDILGEAGSENVYGEDQQKLDVFADSMIYRMNDHTSRLCAMASEEHEDILRIPPHFGTGKYVLLYDPLDGSSNIDVNVSIGTVFAIHHKITSGSEGAERDLLQPASNLAAAGYVIYGSSTMLVYSTGQGVHGFTLDPSVGEFLLSHPDMRFPAKPRYYSVNQGNYAYWTEGVQRYTGWLQGLDGTRKPMSHRYIGSMVADFHRNLIRGGVFYYPGDLSDPDAPAGKLRLMFEAQAFAYLTEQAGGYGSDGIGSLMDIVPHQLHQRAPVFMGNTELVKKAEELIQEHDQEWIAAYTPFRNGEVNVT